jgi:hypothetical protein
MSVFLHTNECHIAVLCVSIAKGECNRVVKLRFCCLHLFSMLHEMVIDVATNFSIVLLHTHNNCLEVFELLNHF